LPEFYRKEFEYAKEEDIYEIIVSRFLEEVGTIARKGLSNGYVEHEDNIRNVKQRVMIQQNIRKNIIRKERLYCRFSEFTNDLAENQIIKYTLFRLLHTPLKQGGLIKKAKHLTQYFENVSLSEILPGQFPKVIYTRLNQRYDTAVNLCRLLIANSTLNLQLTGAIKFSSFLVDMNKLFQKFLFSYLREKLPEWSIKSEPSYDFDAEREIVARPDIVFRKAGRDCLVVDAKYKQVEEYDIVHSDVYQIHAYAVRLNLPIGVLVYPKHESLRDLREVHTVGKTRILIWKIDLSTTKDEFVQECDRFVGRIGKLIQECIEPSIMVS
jgi:5-methylcytosine-specific restriction enzyme subunit McrC